MFDPKTSRYPYTTHTDGHYIAIKTNKGNIFDGKYQYVEKSKSFRFKCFLTRVVLNLIVFPLARVRFGLKIYGKKNIRKNRDLLKKGVVSVSNHVHYWDYIFVMKSIRPFKSHLLSWEENVNDKTGDLVRLVGGIPIPERSIRGKISFLRSVKKLLNDGGWLHIYSEGSMWEYYAPIRPFKTGAANLAIRCDKPIMPIGFSYREPGWIRKKIFKQIACISLNVGEPIFANKELDKGEQLRDLTRRSHEAVCRLVGYKDGENIYPPIFNNNKRINY